MAKGIFTNPLVLSETIAGTILDLRYVKLYEQADDDKIQDIIGDHNYNIFDPIVDRMVNAFKLTELFTGQGIPVTDKFSIGNVYGITYESARVEITSDICEHPVETGSYVADAAIKNPIKAKVNIAMPTALYGRIYKQIQDYYTTKKKIMLQDKFTVHKNMVIAAMPYEMKSNSIDRPIIELELRQINEIEPQGLSAGGDKIPAKKTQNPSDADTVPLGQGLSRAVVTAIDKRE